MDYVCRQDVLVVDVSLRCVEEETFSLFLICILAHGLSKGFLVVSLAEFSKLIDVIIVKQVVVISVVICRLALIPSLLPIDVKIAEIGDPFRLYSFLFSLVFRAEHVERRS